MGKMLRTKNIFKDEKYFLKKFLGFFQKSRQNFLGLEGKNFDIQKA